MGDFQHHALVVTTGYAYPELLAAHGKAVALGLQVSPITEPVVNGYRSFAVFPDGSKVGWEASNRAHDARQLLIAFLRSLAYEDGSSPLRWVEVSFGEYGERVVASSDRSDPETD